MNPAVHLLLPGMNGREVAADYNVIRLDEGTDEKRAKLEMYIAKRIGERLIKHYPNRQWGVDVDLSGMVVIMCPSLSLTKGYHIPMGRHTLHDLQLLAVKAAGEILERHNVSRGRVIDPMLFEDLPRDLRDNVIAPDAAPERY